MGEVANRNYLNPLTIEAQMFLKSIENLSKVHNQVDPNLCTALENVVKAIEKFLEQKPVQITPTKNTQLVAMKEIEILQRVYHCMLCKKDIGKSAEKASLHLVNRHRSATNKKEKRKEEKEKRANMVLPLPKKAKGLIKNGLSKFYVEHLQVAEKLKQIPEYEVIEKQLLALLTPIFPEQTIKLYKFGSRISGMGTRNSDLDIFIDIGNVFNKFENRASLQTVQYLFRIRDALRKTSGWNSMIVIDSARVPIIKVRNSNTGIECDLGLSNSLGFCNTKLIEYFFRLQTIALRMSIFFKKWLERSRLNEHITTYSISLMILYFLQIKNYLPSVKDVQQDLNTVVQVGPWIANFMDKPLSDFNMKQVAEADELQFYIDFCQYYANFKYDIYVVCPYFGKADIAIKEIEGMLPDRYTDFVKQNSSEKDCGLQLNKNMVVQDPIQMNHNVTKSVSKTHLKEFKDYLKQTAEVFAESA